MPRHLTDIAGIRELRDHLSVNQDCDHLIYLDNKLPSHWMSLEGVQILESNYFRVRNDLKNPSHPVSCPMWNPHLLSLSWHQTFAWLQMTTGNATLKGTYSIAGLEKRLPSMSGIWNLLQLLHPEGDHLQRGPLIQPPTLRARAKWWDVTVKPQQEDFTSEKKKQAVILYLNWLHYSG